MEDGYACLKLVEMNGFWAVQERVGTLSWIFKNHALSVAMMLCINVARPSLKYKMNSPRNHSEQFPRMDAAHPHLIGSKLSLTI